MYPNLDCKTFFRLNRINENKSYFIAEISVRELMSKGFSKYIAAFDCFDILNVMLYLQQLVVFLLLRLLVLCVHL